MNRFIGIRDGLRSLFISHEVWGHRIWKFILTFLLMLIMSRTLGYSAYLDHTWISVTIALIGAFVPYGVIASILAVFIALHLAALSLQAAAMFIILLIVGLMSCHFYGSKYSYMVVFMPILGGIYMSFAVPLILGLRGKKKDTAVAVYGGLIYFFLKTVRESASDFLDSTSDMSVVDLIQRHVIGDSLFYAYMIAVVLVLLIIQWMVASSISHAWVLASAVAIVCEEVILAAVYLLHGSADRILMITLGNLGTFAVALFMRYFIMDLNYNRVEHVQFEDDEYYYYVTAIPKVTIASEEKQIKKITQDSTSRFDFDLSEYGNKTDSSKEGD